MKPDTYRHQLLLVFILGIVVSTLTYLQESPSLGKNQYVNKNTWTLVWENEQLQLITGEQELPHHLQEGSLPANVRPVFFQPIPINHASEDLLVSISGVGPVLAKRIVSQRNLTGYYNNYKDLMAVKGIGEHTAMLIAEHVSFEP